MIRALAARGDDALPASVGQDAALRKRASLAMLAPARWAPAQFVNWFAGEAAKPPSSVNRTVA
eukprot:8780194-Lingulodinium_polyedra.AAC.1